MNFPFFKKITTSNIIFILSLGIMLIILVVIFSKRQIARFKFKARNISHLHIGLGLPKVLKQEITARLQRVLKIKFQPILIQDSTVSSIENHFPNGENSSLSRMKAMDETKKLTELIHNRHNIRYEACVDLQDFMFAQSRRLNLDHNLVKSFICQYNHARYGHTNFDSACLTDFQTTLAEVMEEVKNAPILDQSTEVVYHGDGTSGQLLSSLHQRSNKIQAT